MRTINENDKVLVTLSRNDIFPFQEGCSFVAIVEHTPQDTGDMLYLRISHESSEDTQISINTNSSDFIGMVKVRGMVNK